KGYAGYEHAPELAGTSYHVRYRVLKADLGRWLTRDPEGYVDGMSLYSYVQGMAITAVDPMGLCTQERGKRAICFDPRAQQRKADDFYRRMGRTPPPQGTKGLGPAFPAPPPARFPPMLSSLGPASCFGGGCNPNMSGSEFAPECGTITRPYPPPSFPCNSQSRKDACQKWAAQQCGKRQGSWHDTLCRDLCISEAARCCAGGGCNKSGKSSECIAVGIKKMARCNWAPEQDQQTCYAACWAVATAPCARVCN